MFVVNIHGYGGKSNNSTYQALQSCEINNEHFEILSLQFDYSLIYPQTVLNILKSEISKRGTPFCIVGTSFGGFFAYCLGVEFNCPVILINPCLVPFLVLPSISQTYRPEYIKDLCRIFGNYMKQLPANLTSLIIDTNDELIQHDTLTNTLVSAKSDLTFISNEHGHDISDISYLSTCISCILNYFDINMKGIIEQS